MESEYIKTAAEAMRIIRRIHASFSDGKNVAGSGFVGAEKGTVITCAHIVCDDKSSLRANKIKVNGGNADIKALYPDIDLAILNCSETDVCKVGDSSALLEGNQVIFAGTPAGVAVPSVFFGIISARGEGLVEFPRCELLQINGMINSGNSGGPVFRAGDMEVLGIITAKFVPLLREIDNLSSILKKIPQFPSEVGVGKIDFSKFVNLTIQALRSISGSLRLVQVGTGYAIPVNLLF